jgi:branched-subunit amino acid aminotransferase/4-amino-4-deoxychorismate lyase
MSIRVYIDGQDPREPEAAMVSVFDRGFLFGDSVYETIALVDRRLTAFLPSTWIDSNARRDASIWTYRHACRWKQAIRETVAAAGEKRRAHSGHGHARRGQHRPRSRKRAFAASSS